MLGISHCVLDKDRATFALAVPPAKRWCSSPAGRFADPGAGLAQHRPVADDLLDEAAPAVDGLPLLAEPAAGPGLGVAGDRAEPLKRDRPDAHRRGL